MPSSRRRKFSVQNEGGGRIAAPKDAAGASGSLQSPYNRSTSNLEMKPGKCRSKMLPHCSKVISPLEIVAERVESSSSVLTVKMRVKTVDKDVTASSSKIDLFNIMSSNESTDVPISPSVVPGLTNRDARQTIRSNLHRDKPRQHRMKVRSPRRRVVVINPTEISKRSVATGAIDWMQEMEVYNNIMNAPPTHIVETETTEFGDRPSEHSLDDMCRICHGGESLSLELGQLISACNCRGTVGRVHVRCLERWLTESGKSRCELCGSRYATRRVHRYGVARALLMWILSQNAKQLMVDSLGIMLMSPLAVLAAWLSGRTLAGLMTQEGHVTPWPLASTFVLACMTLVCYYCWIVSAATRHALGWWIWYRSQYEVRLQLQDSEDAS